MPGPILGLARNLLILSVKPPASTHRLYELDAFRGIAILMVVLFHYTYTVDVGWMLPQRHFAYPFWFGHLGVCLFFIVSGFVIYMTLQRVTSVADFAANRFSRLYPAYWGSLVLNLLIFVLFPIQYNLIKPIDWLYNLSMVQGLAYGNQIDRVYWTLAVEMVFYVQMGILLAVGKLDKIEWVGAGALLVKVGLTLAQVPGRDLIGNVGGLMYVHLFFAGILFFRIKNLGPTRQRFVLLAACCAIELLRIYKQSAEPQPLLDLGRWEVFAVMAGCTLFFFLLFLRFALRKVDLQHGSWLSWVGSISYSLYLTHNNLGCTLLEKWYKLGLPPLAALALNLVVVLALAQLFYTYIESPTARFAKKLMKRRGARLRQAS